MKYLKQYIICAAAALVCLAALAGCSARNSSDSKLILDGNKFRIGQCTIREITAAGFDLETDADPDQNIPAGTMLAHPILLLKKDVPAASAVIANPGKTDLPLSQCRVYKLTGFYTIDGTDGASQVIYGGTDFKGYDREKVEKSMGRPTTAVRTRIWPRWTSSNMPAPTTWRCSPSAGTEPSRRSSWTIRATR